MKIIEIDCFTNNQVACELTSSLAKIEIINPLERQFLLKVKNNGELNCDLSMQFASLSQSELWARLLLNFSLPGSTSEVFSGRSIFSDFIDNLLERKLTLGSLTAGRSLDLLLDFDLLPLVVAEEIVDLDFDLKFDFVCSEEVVEIGALAAESLKPNAAASAVLAKQSPFEPAEAAALNLSWLFYLLSGLFVLCFFVIIKFVHGKKKK